MSRISRQILIGAFILSLLSSGCGMLAGSSSPRMNGTPGGWRQLPGNTATATGLALGPVIPITGENVAYMQCQFCVGQETRAVLIFPDFAYFDVEPASPVTCLTADVVNGRRIVICRSPQTTSFHLSVCSDPANCLQFPVTLQPCDQLQGNPAPPVYLTPVNRSRSDRDRNPPQPESTAVPALTQGVPADPPDPTQPPAPTQGGGGGGGGGGEEGGDIVICHVSPGNPNERKTMKVGISAWENEHSKHGDSKGPC